MSEEFLGRGWHFPIGLNSRGAIALSSGEQDIREAIQIVLSTVPGERVMRPEFGCELHSLVFASNDPTTLGLVDYHVREALLRWEPRIEVLEVSVNSDWSVSQDVRMLIDIRYRIRSTNAIHNLVFPYYQMGEER